MTVAPWLAVDDLPPNAPTLPGDEQQQAAGWQRLIAQATAALWALSGGRWGGEVEVVVEVWAPAGSSCDDPCRRRAVRLPHRDARQLTAVTTATGTPLDAADYVIERGGYLAAAPGRAARLPTEHSSLVLTYVAGRNPPADGRAAAVELAVELGREVVEPGSSALPGNVTSIARQGVTMTYQPAQTIIAAGATGLYAVDLWLATVNPTRARRPARSWSPDTDSRYRIIETGAPTP